jgi:hypothetical protein
MVNGHFNKSFALTPSAVAIFSGAAGSTLVRAPLSTVYHTSDQGNLRPDRTDGHSPILQLNPDHTGQEAGSSTRIFVTIPIEPRNVLLVGIGQEDRMYFAVVAHAVDADGVAEGFDVAEDGGGDGGDRFAAARLVRRTHLRGAPGACPPQHEQAHRQDPLF